MLVVVNSGKVILLIPRILIRKSGSLPDILQNQNGLSILVTNFHAPGVWQNIEHAILHSLEGRRVFIYVIK